MNHSMYSANFSAALIINDSHSNISNINGFDKTISEDYYAYFERIINTRIILCICLFGLIGNIFNVIVLAQKSRTRSMSRMEKSADFGLTCLSISDLLLCVSTLPYSFCWKQGSSSSKDFWMIYTAYSDGVINTFIMSSTWLTVMMALSRYLAICHPFKARRIIGMKFARSSTIAIAVFCCLFNIPRYFFWKIENIEWSGRVVYFTMPGLIKSNEQYEKIYLWIYFLVGIIFPLIVLTFSNLNLLNTLRSAKRSQSVRRHATNNKKTSYRITLTLVIIVIVYSVCLVPAEIINFLKSTNSVIANTGSFNLAVAVLNTFQAINFAFNFILYCIVNTQFRKQLLAIVAPCRQKKRQQRTMHQSTYTIDFRTLTGTEMTTM